MEKLYGNYYSMNKAVLEGRGLYPIFLVNKFDKELIECNQCDRTLRVKLVGGFLRNISVSIESNTAR